MKLDALVIVHPDLVFAPVRTYPGNLLRTIDCYAGQGLPVFWIDDNPSGDGVLRRELLSRALFPIGTKDVTQQLAFARRAIARKKATTLGFGGQYLDQCVQAYAALWCREVISPVPGRFSPASTSLRQFDRGYVLPEISH